MTIDTGNTGFMLLCSSLVMLMTPGLAFFYGGLVSRRNVLTIMMQSFVSMGWTTVIWFAVGYSLTFSGDVGGVIGNLDMAFLRGVTLDTPSPTPGIPLIVHIAYQMMFAVITPALITGAFAERMKFSGFVLFTLLWATFIYDPLAHWVWGVGGWVRNLGALDFAGGTVVHISSGVAGLVCAIVVKRRLGHGKEPMQPHNLPMTLLGASLLWFGWFGFNAGSALASGALATSTFTATNTATAAAALAWMVAEWIYRGKPSALGAASGAVAGLVAITPASGFVGPMSSIWIGIGAGVLCYTAVMLKPLFGYDDALDAVGVHGVGGTWGALATGLFASKAVNSAGADGLFFGNPKQLIIQAMAVLVTWVFVFVGTLIVLAVVAAITGLRVNEEEEQSGLDLSQHDEKAYSQG